MSFDAKPLNVCSETGGRQSISCSSKHTKVITEELELPISIILLFNAPVTCKAWLLKFYRMAAGRN